MASTADAHSHVVSHAAMGAPPSPSTSSSDGEHHSRVSGCSHQRARVAGSPYRRCKKCDAESSQRWRRSHPWKTTWLSFVRRAYRKFGKEHVARYDLRWKGMGVRALADAITRQAGPGGKVCTPQALAWADAEASLLAEERVRSRSVGAALDSPTGARADSEDAPSRSAGTALDFPTGAGVPVPGEEDALADVEEAPSHAVAATPDAEASMPVKDDDDDSGPVVAAAPQSATACVPELEGQHWVLTWPADMASLDLQRLVLIGRVDALHRTRNAGRKRKRKAEAAAVSVTAMVAEEKQE